MTEKVKLAGGPEKTATWIWLDGIQLKVEFYDFSETAQRMFGNDIAYTLTVPDLTQVLSLSQQSQAALVAWMRERFQSYFEIQRWLEENGIRYTKEIESWA